MRRIVAVGVTVKDLFMKIMAEIGAARLTGKFDPEKPNLKIVISGDHGLRNSDIIVSIFINKHHGVQGVHGEIGWSGRKVVTERLTCRTQDEFTEGIVKTINKLKELVDHVVAGLPSIL